MRWPFGIHSTYWVKLDHQSESVIRANDKAYGNTTFDTNSAVYTKITTMIGNVYPT